MTDTVNLALPFIDASQAQKHITHNEALRALDSLVQLAVLDATRSAPPPSPLNGQRHIVASGPTGAWAGRARAIAVWQDNAWAFLVPRTGWCAWSIADTALLVFDGSAWRPAQTQVTDNLPGIGINTSASSPNFLSVRSNASLFNAIGSGEGGTGDVRIQMSKESAGKTASIVFSDAFSGRAEFGITGDDDFRFKVSPNGGSWFEALRIDRTNGRVSFPSNNAAREMLSANRVYYVRPDGNDSNNGLSDQSGGAFLTIQRAVDAVCALDLGGQLATIQLGNGTYPGQVFLKPYVGIQPPLIQGNASTPGTCVIGATNAIAISNVAAGAWQVNDLKIQTTGWGHAIYAAAGGVVRFQNVQFGTCAAAHLCAGAGGTIVATNGYAITGNANFHVISNGFVDLHGVAIAYQNAPAFSGANVLAGRGGVVDIYGASFVNGGTVTGQRYVAQHNGVISTSGASATFIPGNSAGNASQGGLYV